MTLRLMLDMAATGVQEQHPGASQAPGQDMGRGQGRRQTGKPPEQRRELRLDRWVRWPPGVPGVRCGEGQEQHPGKTGR